MPDVTAWGCRVTVAAVVDAFVAGPVLGASLARAAVHRQLHERTEILAGDLLNEVRRLRSAVDTWRGIARKELRLN